MLKLHLMILAKWEVLVMLKLRQLPDERRAQILQAALVVATQPGGWSSLTRENVAEQAGCAESLISRYFGTMTAFKRQIMRSAISTENLSIIAQGLACYDLHANKAPKGLKARAFAKLAKDAT